MERRTHVCPAFGKYSGKESGRAGVTSFTSFHSWENKQRRFSEVRPVAQGHTARSGTGAQARLSDLPSDH